MSVIGVTGAHGFVGREIVSAAKKKGHEVHSFVRKPENKNEHYWEATSDFDASTIKGIDFDTIIHCAAKADDWGDFSDFFSVNVTGTSHALAIAPEARFVHVSTSSVYLNLASRTNVTEQSMIPQSRLKKLSFYAYTKLLAENIVLNDRRSAGRIILRPHIIYGPNDTTLIPRLREKIKTDKKGKKYLLLPGGAESVHSITDVDRFTSFVMTVTECNANAFPGNPIFNVSDEAPVLLSQKIQDTLTEIEGETVHINSIPGILAQGVASLSMFKASLTGSRPEFTRYVIRQFTENTLLDVTKMQTFLANVKKEN